MEIKHNPERFTFDIAVTQPEQYLGQMRNASREVIDQAIRKVAALEEKNAEQAMLLLLREKLAEATVLIQLARGDWLDANAPGDGTDCVTPYDKYFYSLYFQGAVDGTTDTPCTTG